MALLHEATISPRKDELIEPWLRTRPWWDGVVERGPVGAFRLDDPAGQVGIECFLFGSGSTDDAPAGSTLFVPVTYRGAPLPGAAAHLVGTLEHSVLGTRYVYDACADPVFVATLLDAIRSGGRQADLLLRRADGTETVREPAVTARGEGVPSVPSHDPGTSVSPTDGPDRTTIVGAGWELTVVRRFGDVPQVPAALHGPALHGPALVGAFVGGPDLRLAVVSG